MAKKRLPNGSLALVTAERALAKRPKLTVKPKVVNNKDGIGGFFLHGTIAVLAASKGSEELAAIEKAVKSGDKRSIGRASKKFFERADALETVGLNEAAEVVSGAQSVGQLRYGDKLVASGIVTTDDTPVYLTYIPITGGKLDSRQFVVDQLVREGKKDLLDVLVVITQPELNDLERRLLEQLSGEESEAHVGQSAATAAFVLWAVAITAAHAFVWAMVVTATVQICFKGMDERLGGVSLGDDMIERLAAGPAAATLLDMRSEIMIEGPAR